MNNRYDKARTYLYQKLPFEIDGFFDGGTEWGILIKGKNDNDNVNIQIEYLKNMGFIESRGDSKFRYISIPTGMFQQEIDKWEKFLYESIKRFIKEKDIKCDEIFEIKNNMLMIYPHPEKKEYRKLKGLGFYFTDDDKAKIMANIFLSKIWRWWIIDKSEEKDFELAIRNIFYKNQIEIFDFEDKEDKVYIYLKNDKYTREKLKSIGLIMPMKDIMGRHYTKVSLATLSRLI